MLFPRPFLMLSSDHRQRDLFTQKSSLRVIFYLRISFLRMNLLDDPEMLTDMMSMEEAEFIAYQNGRKGSISAPLIQSLAVQSMYYYIHHVGCIHVSEAIRWTKANIKHQGSMEECTMRRWLKHYEAYGKCLYQTERR